jgi:hypothetical protein
MVAAQLESEVQAKEVADEPKPANQPKSGDHMPEEPKPEEPKPEEKKPEETRQ